MLTSYQTKLRYFLEDKGMPPILAFMAAQNAVNFKDYEDATDAIWSSFTWAETEQGHEFWSTIARSCYELDI